MNISDFAVALRDTRRTIHVKFPGDPISAWEGMILPDYSEIINRFKAVKPIVYDPKLTEGLRVATARAQELIKRVGAKHAETGATAAAAIRVGLEL